MRKLTIQAGPFQFEGDLEEALAPNTCKRFLDLLPYESKVIHARWSGEAVWIPLGHLDLGIGFENHTSHPSRGDVLLYPGGVSETEILIAYGSASFASKVGQLAGNHFLTITSGRENLEAFGKLVLWEGAQKIVFYQESS